jgi:hypothetical protein
VQGELSNRQSSIQPPGGAKHAVDGDWDGTLEVTVGGKKFTVSAEEWRTTIQP